VQITGVAWTGGGVITKVDISTDGGKSWKESKLQTPVHSKAHTRFTYDWNWDGEEAVLMSRATDENGDFQLSRFDLYKAWGLSDEDAKKPTRSIHTNAIQPWRVSRDGRVHDAMFS
jgi:sulfane dehydrogenase subunit SoxC